MTPAPLLMVLLAAAPQAVPVALPGGEGGIGFDDLVYPASLGRVLAPGGRSGNLDLVAPASRAVEAIPGFSGRPGFQGGHSEGTTSADFGQGLLFASDRSIVQLDVVDPASRKIVASARLAGGPDYVRYVAPTREVWVTEPRRKAIEIFRLGEGRTLERAGELTLPDGPESLVIDATRGRAYTHSWAGDTYAVDLKTRRQVATWKNGCQGARGIALDEAKGLLFVGCEEGRAVALDVVRDGARRGEAPAGKGVDIIAYAPALGHLYVPGADAATLTVLEVGPRGELKPVATWPTAPDAHCVAADDRGGVWVCDPQAGRLLYFHDSPAPR